METQIKKDIKKLVKRNGSHIGAIKSVIVAKYPNVDFELYKDFTRELFIKKYASVESEIKSSVRF